MSKRLILILAFAFVVGLSLTAYAEVQNVKVSGDFTVYGIARNNFDLAKSPVSGSAPDTSTYDDKDRSLASITKVRFDADLTDNVSMAVRLFNERNWNGENALAGQTNRNIGWAVATAGEGNVGLHVAYVTLKEFLYSPLTLTIGRQPMRFCGNGFLIGDPDTNGFSSVTNLSAGDLSSRKGMDAVRATFDYNPLTLDVVFAKMSEGRVNENDDTTLSAVNAKYALNKGTTVEGFLFSKAVGADSSTTSATDPTIIVNVDTGLPNSLLFGDATTNNQKTDKTHAVGARVVNSSINNLILDVQGAYQFGTYNPKFDPNARWISATDKAQTAKRSAYGGEVIAIYNLKDFSAISKWQPMLIGAFVYLSGEKRDRTGNKTYHGWDPMFEDQTMGHIANAISGMSNIKAVQMSAQAKPTDDVTAKLDYSAYWFNKKFPEGRLVNLSGVTAARTFRMGNKSFAGQEVDLTLTYDYTEDVQFSLLGGILFPSKAFNAGYTSAGAVIPDRANATELIGSMKVTF